MLAELPDWLPDRQLHLCADGAYACLAGADLAGTHLTSRLRRDAAPHQGAPPRTGRPGRPRTKGDRLPAPPELAAKARPRDWVKATINVPGHAVDKLIHTRDVLWYSVNPKELVGLVIVRDPAGVEPDDFFVTTDLSASGADTAARYAGRWSIEVCFRDVKQDLGGENPQSWKRQGPERAACLSLWLHATTWCWYLAEHPAGDTWIPPTLVPPQKNPKLPRHSRRATPHTLVATNNHHVNRRQPRPRQDQNYQRPTRHSRLRRLRVRKATVVDLDEVVPLSLMILPQCTDACAAGLET